MDNFIQNLMKQTRLKNLFYQKIVAKKPKWKHVSLPTSYGFVMPIAWKVIYHGGDMLASCTG